MSFNLLKTKKELRQVLEALGGCSHSKLKELYPVIVSID